jgi:hypothetical protein
VDDRLQAVGRDVIRAAKEMQMAYSGAEKTNDRAPPFRDIRPGAKRQMQTLSSAGA